MGIFCGGILGAIIGTIFGSIIANWLRGDYDE